MGPSPCTSPLHLAQTFLMYTYNNNLIIDSSNKPNLTKNNTKTSLELFLILPITAIRFLSRIHVAFDMLSTLAVNSFTCPPTCAWDISPNAHAYSVTGPPSLVRARERMTELTSRRCETLLIVPLHLSYWECTRAFSVAVVSKLCAHQCVCGQLTWRGTLRHICRVHDTVRATCLPSGRIRSAGGKCREGLGLITCNWMILHSSPPVLSPYVSTRVFTPSIETGISCQKIVRNILNTPQLSCSILEPFSCAMTSVTRSCHSLAPLHGPLFRQGTTTIDPFDTCPLA